MIWYCTAVDYKVLETGHISGLIWNRFIICELFFFSSCVSSDITYGSARTEAWLAQRTDGAVGGVRVWRIRVRQSLSLYLYTRR